MAIADIEDNIYHEELPNVCAAVTNKAKKCCSVTALKGFFPVVSWLPRYKPKFLMQDFVAGLTVGLTTVPQAIAYGTIAGLPPQYGLYSAFMGCFVYIIFGTCKDITVGPTAIMSLMVQTHVQASPDFATLSCFLSGIVIFAMGLLNLGVLVQFISVPVVTGFITAAAITISSGQINSLFGIKSSSNEFVESWVHFFTHIKEISRNDAILGISTLVFLLLMREVKGLSCGNKTVNKYLSLSSNAFAVIAGIILCYFISHDGWLPFKVSGDITPGIPPFKPPPFSTTLDGRDFNFADMIAELGTSLAAIPLISLLEMIAISKAFSKGKIVDSTQEMVALGLCNIMGSFVSSMPVTSSFTRCAINNSSGVKTQLGGAVTGVLVLMSLAFLTTTFYYVPKATLSAIIIVAMVFMVEYKRIAEIWRCKKLDFIPYTITVITCVFWSLEYGIVCGIVVSLVFTLYKSARPKIDMSSEKVNDLAVGIVKVKENLNYSAAEYLKAKVVKFVATHGTKIALVIISGEEIVSIDSTVALNITSLHEDLRLVNCKLICWNWNIAAAGVICRLHPKERSMFKFGATLQEIVMQETQNVNMTENGSIVVAL